MVAIAVATSLVIVLLLLVIGWVSFQDSVINATFTVRHYVNLYTDQLAYRTFLNTLAFAGVSLGVALAIGIPVAWLVTRTDLPGTTAILSCMTLGVLIPGFFTAMGWLFL